MKKSEGEVNPLDQNFNDDSDDNPYSKNLKKQPLKQATIREDSDEDCEVEMSIR